MRQTDDEIAQEVWDLLEFDLEYKENYTYEDFYVMLGVAKVFNSCNYRKKPDHWITKDGRHIPIFDNNIEMYVKRKLKEKIIESQSVVKDYVKTEYQKYKESNCESAEPAYKYPKSIAGVKKGDSMSFDEADHGRANPLFEYEDDGYKRNCQCCVIAHEARLRGYNVQAVARQLSGKTNQLAYNPFWAWLDPKTNKKCGPRKLWVRSPLECYQELQRTVKQGQRYHFAYYWGSKRADKINIRGHIVTIDRDERGRLRYYDPQTNTKYVDYQILIKLGKHIIFNDTALKPQILRVDDKKFNPYFINDVVQKSSFSN